MQQASGEAVRLVLDGEVVEAAAVLPTTTVLDYLRGRGLCGVKEGCAEGDCGACMVAVGELDGDRVRWEAVNACIRYLPTLDGKAVRTVHGLASADGTLHPVQQAVVDAHASQCGFCTPGFVMSLFALHADCAGRPATRDEVLAALSGNLCRCTGYRPLIDAGLAMHQPARPVDDSGLASQLRALQRDAALRLPGFHAPRSAQAFAAALEDDPDALLLAGGTDVGLWTTKQLRELPSILYLGDVAEFHAIGRDADGLTIGAAVTLERAFRALVDAYPALDELHRRFASRPVRNSGTLCGNVANGSPIGDSMPALMALGARVRLRKGAARRELALEDFYLGYQKKDLARGEFVEAIWVPLPSPGLRFATYKVSKRFDQDISAVCMAIAVQSDAGTIRSARIAYGGMAATPARAARAEAALVGQPDRANSYERAAIAVQDDFLPLTDMRASAAYRRALAANLLRRFAQAAPGDMACSVQRIGAVEAA